MKKDKKLSDKIHVKKALIVFPIVLVLVGTILIGAFSPLLMSEGNVDQSNATAEQLDLEDLIKDDKALNIIDIHENLDNYIDKDVELEGFFMKFDENTDVFGVEVPLGEGNITPISLSYDLKDKEMIKDIKETDLVKASGTISSFDEIHKEEGEEDHTHTQPRFNIENIEIVR